MRVLQFLDDLHNADASSLSMIEAFGRARVNILILATVRTSNP
jgi:predicted ATPase